MKTARLSQGEPGRFFVDGAGDWRYNNMIYYVERFRRPGRDGGRERKHEYVDCGQVGGL